MDQLGAMRTFVRVAEAGSFAAVALQLGAARSAVTRQIAALEARLGTRLITRSTRRLTLTAAGSAYLERCRDILALVDEAESEVHEARGDIRGGLRISLPLSLGVRYLMPMIAEFTAAHPRLEVEVDFTDRRVDLISEGMDLALRVTARLEETAVARRLGASRSVVVASPSYLERHGRPAHPRDLIGHECFGYVPALRSKWPFFINGRLTWVRTQGRLHANNGDALLRATVQGLGITYQPMFIVADALRAGSVVPILERYRCQELGLFAVFPSGRYVTRPVRALTDFLAARLAGAPEWERTDGGTKRSASRPGAARAKKGR